MKIIKDSICCKKKEIEKQTGGGPVNNDLSSVTTSEVAVNTNYDTRTVMNICKCINEKLNENLKKYNIASWHINVYSNAIEGRAYIYKGDIMNGVKVASIFVSLRKGGYIVKLSFGKDKDEKNDCAIFKMQIDDKVTKGFNTDENCSVKEFENILNREGYSFFDKIKDYFEGEGLYHDVSDEDEYECLCDGNKESSPSIESFKNCTKGWDKTYRKQNGFVKFYWNCSDIIEKGYGKKTFFYVNKGGDYYDKNIVIYLSDDVFFKFYVVTQNEIHKF